MNLTINLAFFNSFTMPFRDSCIEICCLLFQFLWGQKGERIIPYLLTEAFGYKFQITRQDNKNGKYHKLIRMALVFVYIGCQYIKSILYYHIMMKSHYFRALAYKFLLWAFVSVQHLLREEQSNCIKYIF